MSFIPTFGRLPAPDANDARYPLRAILSGTFVPKTHYWAYFGQPLNQRADPHCVGYSWTHFLLAAPTTHTIKSSVRINSKLTADTIYYDARKIDEWDGEDYEGTSVRAGAKVLQAQGRIVEYRWASNITDVQQYVVQRGVVVMGTVWYDGMMQTDSKGFITPTGNSKGGHAYCIIGYSLPRNAFRILNSWGTGWGENGRAWLRLDDARALLDDGEACSAIERKM